MATGPKRAASDLQEMSVVSQFDGLIFMIGDGVIVLSGSAPNSPQLVAPQRPGKRVTGSRSSGAFLRFSSGAPANQSVTAGKVRIFRLIDGSSKVRYWAACD